MPKLIYISAYPSSVFDSQVVTLLNHLTSKVLFQDVYIILSTRSLQIDAQRIYDLGLNKSVKVLFIKSYPNTHFFQFLRTSSLKKALNQIKLNHESIIHTRSDNFSIALSEIELNGAKIITDYRGVSIEESQLYVKQNPITTYLKDIYFKKSLRTSIHISHSISTVSSSLKKYITAKHNMDDECVNVNSCIVSDEFRFSSENREQIREQFSIKEDEYVGVFLSGGTSRWQLATEIVSALNKNNIKIFNMTRTKIHGKNIINVFTDYHNVPKYLSAADFGVIFRDDNLVNRVACPVKFVEYVACGLPVIANHSVKLISDYLNSTGFGVVIQRVDEINHSLLNNLPHVNRKVISEYGINQFSVERIGSNYITLYQNVLEGHSKWLPKMNHE